MTASRSSTRDPDPADPPILEIRDLRTYLFTRTGVVKAVDGISFALRPGETLGIVGESGCGKSMTALSIMGLLPKPVGRIIGGQILLEGQDLVQMSETELQKVRGSRICMIPQDPMTSLNPVFSVGDQLIETLGIDQSGSRRRRLVRAIELFKSVRIPAPAQRLAAYPHQLSGGMRQRVVGAISMSRAPKVLIADEATTSLDATIQYQYLRLLKEIQEATGVALIFITHDFGIVASVCDRAAVMYAGRIVEIDNVADLFAHPAHPYTKALLGSIPNGDDVDALRTIDGQPPALDALPSGCSFAPRCPEADRRCTEEYPPNFIESAEHIAACWRLEDRWKRA